MIKEYAVTRVIPQRLRPIMDLFQNLGYDLRQYEQVQGTQVIGYRIPNVMLASDSILGIMGTAFKKETAGLTEVGHQTVFSNKIGDDHYLLAVTVQNSEAWVTLYV